MWSLALVLVGAAALDAFWAVPQQRAAQQRRALQVEIMRCREAARARAVKVEDIHLLTPTQAAR